MRGVVGVQNEGEKKMKKINALVVDDSKEFTNGVEEYFRNNIQIHIAKVISDGNEVIQYLQNYGNAIDIVIMDLILPGKDGISLLEEMRSLGLKKHVLVLSSYGKDYTIRMANQFDVDYFMLKPCDLKAVEARVLDIVIEAKNDLCADKEVNLDIQLKVSELLHELGVPSQIKGYQYLREGILMLYQSTGLIGGITKEVYPEIALRYNTTPSRVERAIRHAIEISWNRADYELMNKIFGHSIDYDRAKPTNSEFMVTLSDNLRLTYNTQKSYV